MFGNSYQNGHYFEVWDSKVSNDKNELYKSLIRIVPPSNKSYFDKEVKSFIYSLEGQSSKLILPASDQKQLALHQRFLVLHIYIPIGCHWSLELGISDINGVKRRINFTTTQGKNEVKFFSVRYPIENLEKGKWLFLAFNVQSFMQIFKNQVYRSLDHITVTSNCKMRRIFTMKQWAQWEIPKSFWLNNQIQQQFQLIQYRELSLPKIIGNKSSVHEGPSSPNQIDKLGSIKQSKSNLIKSQIAGKQMQKSSILSSLSPGKSKKQSISKQIRDIKQKLNAGNSMLSVKNEKKIKQAANPANSSKKGDKSAQLKNKPQYQQKKIGVEKAKSLITKKSPIFEKSFQQDQALLYRPSKESQNNFQTSHQSFLYLQTYEKNFQKWEQQEPIHASSKPISQKVQALTQQSKKNPAKKERTVLTKQNQKKKVESRNNIELQLIYDQMVGYYYHPESNTYFQVQP